MQEAAALLGAIRDDVRRTSGGAPGRGLRLQRTLAALCERGGFRGAAIADRDGLPLAVHGLPLKIEVAGAAASLLGGVLDGLAKVLGHADLGGASVDVGFEDKLVVRTVGEGEAQFYLLVMCPQAVDERPEIELSLAELGAIVGRG